MKNNGKSKLPLVKVILIIHIVLPLLKFNFISGGDLIQNLWIWYNNTSFPKITNIFITHETVSPPQAILFIDNRIK